MLAHRPDPVLKYLTGSVSSDPPMISYPVSSNNAQTKQTTSQSSTSQDHVLNTDVLDGGEVLIFGAGAVGGWVAYLLATIAKLIIHLMDFDKVEYQNTKAGRTIYIPGQVNQKKVYAAKSRIERDYPNSTIRPYPYNVMDIPDSELRRLARRVAIVINAIDDAVAMLRVNDLLYSITEVLYVALHAGAASGHVILTIPYVSACLRCSLGITSAADIHTLHGEPGLALDIKNVANQCATIALEIIHSKATGKPVERWDLTKNIIYFANRQGQLSPDGPGLRLQRADKRSGCSICSAAPNNRFLRS